MAITAFPTGVGESKLEKGFLGMAEILSPFWFHFVMSLVPAERAEVIRWDTDRNAGKACISFSLHLFGGYKPTVLEGPSLYTSVGN